MQQHIQIHNDYGWFIGSFKNNLAHKHYAIQLSITLEEKITIKTKSSTLESNQPVLIASNISHQILSDSKQFLLLINPASPIGHFWKNLTKSNIQEIDFNPATDLKKLLHSKPTKQQNSKINAIIQQHDCFCHTAIHQGDMRINQALEYLQKNYHRIVSLQELAAHCHLSESRFLHLFKSETGISFRRAQSWNKLTQAIPYFGKKSLTEIAHLIGFADSAHLSRTFKENFGFSPREFLKISQFIQV